MQHMMHLHQRRQGHQSSQLSQQEWQQQCNLDRVVAGVCQYPSGDVEEGHIAGAADKEVVRPALGNQQRWQRHNKKEEEAPNSPTQAYIRRNSTKLIRSASDKFNHPRGALMGRKSFVASTADVQHAEQQPEKQAGVPTILQVGRVSCCFAASEMACPCHATGTPAVFHELVSIGKECLAHHNQRSASCTGGHQAQLLLLLL